MNQILKDMKEIGSRLQTETGENYRGTREYLASLMKLASQEDIIHALPKLTYHELKHVVAAGIPGDAFRMGQELLAAHKEKLRAYMEDENRKASMTVESEEPKEND